MAGKNKNIIRRPWSVRIWKNCARCVLSMGPRLRPRDILYKASGTFLSQYGPPAR